MTDLKNERHCKFAGEYSDIFIYLKLRKDVDALITPKYVLHNEKRDDPDSP
ncbi:MAG: hypothetical protein LBH32_03715 [Dysgonamonadaceae bacterium]|nr:hypothetical protein [Dysgonamonadaceae bacterium]